MDWERAGAVLLYCVAVNIVIERVDPSLCNIAVQLFTRKAAQLLYSNQRLQRWCFDVELLFLARHFEVPVVEASVNWTEVPGGFSWQFARVVSGLL